MYRDKPQKFTNEFTTVVKNSQMNLLRSAKIHK